MNASQFKLYRVLIAFIMFFYLYNQASAQKVSLDECVKLAIKNYPSIQKSKYDLESAQWDFKTAKLKKWPKLELFNLMGIVPDAEGDAITGDTIDDHYGFFNKLDLQFSLPLVTFGRLKHGIKAAEKGVEVEKAAYKLTLEDIVYRVHKLYYGLVLSKQLHKSLKDLKDRFKEAYDIAQERLDKGKTNVTEADVLKLKIGLSGMEQGVRNIERQMSMARSSLIKITGWKTPSSFEPADKRIKPVKIKLATEEEYIELAKNNNSTLKRLKAAVQAAKERYLSEKAKFYPMFLAVGGVKYAVAPGREDQDNPFLNDEYNYFSAGAALALKWNMNVFETRAEVARKRAEYLSLEKQFEEAKQGIELKVKEAYAKVLETKKNLESSWESRKAGRALLILSFTNFKFGIGSGKDVFDGLSIYARTADDYYKAVYEYNMAVAKLKKLVGTIVSDKTEMNRNDKHNL